MNRKSLRRMLPSLAALEAFEAVARLGSVTRAAEELGRTQSAVSRQVFTLEEFTKRALFTRKQRRLLLTQAGVSYSNSASRFLDQLEEEAAGLITTGVKDRRLTISVPPTFGSRWLIPRLGKFPAAQLGIDLSVVTGRRSANAEKPVADVSVKHGRGDWPGLVSYELVKDEVIAVVAPSLLKSTNSTRVEDFKWLHMTIRPDDWEIWTKNRCEAEFHKPGMKFQTFIVLIEAASLGLGAAIVPTFYVQNELANGQLVAIFGKPVLTGRSFWLVHSPRLTDAPKVADFRDWLLSVR